MANIRKLNVTKLILGNSYSKIIGLSVLQFNQLKQLLSYTHGNYFSGYGVRRKTLLNKRGEFPTGLLLKVGEYLLSSGIMPEIVDKRQLATKLLDFPKMLKTEKPYNWQVKASNVAVIANGTVVAPTGTGKSYAIALVVSILKVKTLIVVPTIEIKTQLMSDFEMIFGKTPYIIIENIDSTTLSKHKGIGLLILDEVHHAAAKTYHKLNKTSWNEIYHRICFTATPFRNNSDETLLYESIAGEVIYELTYKEAIKKGYIVPIEAYYIDVPKQDTEAFTYREVYNELVVRNKTLNEIISNLLLSLYKESIPTLCLVKEVAHGNNIQDLVYLPFVNGKDEESRQYITQFKQGKLNTLIGTEGILGEGVDTKPCEYVIIAGLGKAKSAFMQKVGRALRRYKGKESGKVIIFRNSSHKFLLRHFNEQKKILLDQYGIIPIKLNLEDN